MPACFNRSKPVPLTRSSKSVEETTTRFKPALMIASVQGGVRPW